MSRTLVCFLEELSAKVFLEGLLPRFLPDDIQIKYIVFEGKQDLEKQLIRKLRGWLAPHSVFLIMRDQDAARCTDVKQRLVGLCERSEKNPFKVRIACHELESFFFGDLSSVEKALGLKGLQKYAKSETYRIPDSITNPALKLGKITKGVYQKVGGSREIGKHISLVGNTSRSYQALLSGIKQLCQIDS